MIKGMLLDKLRALLYLVSEGYPSWDAIKELEEDLRASGLYRHVGALRYGREFSDDVFCDVIRDICRQIEEDEEDEDLIRAWKKSKGGQ